MITTKHLIVSLTLGLTVGLRVGLTVGLTNCGAAEKAFVHPGMLHNRAELEFVKARIATGVEPWKSAWEQLRGRTISALSFKPKATAKVVRGPYNRPNVGGDDMLRDASAAYSHALQWYMTGEKAHAEKAIEVFSAYSSTLESVGGHDARLLVGMAGINFLNAAELVRHTYGQWNEDDQKRFEKLLRTVFYPVIKDFYPTANGNWDAAMIQTMLAMGVFLDDRVMFDRAVDYCLKGPGNGAIANYFNELGECQESGRDQGHTQMGLGYLGCAAEIAFKQGVDLYGAHDNRLALGFEYTAKYNLGHEVPYRPYRSYQGRYHYETISDKSRGHFSSIYERVYHHYHDRLGMEMPFTGRVVRKIRPEPWQMHHASWGSLMCAELPPPRNRQRARNTDLERFIPNHGNTVYNATGLLRQWPPEGPKELWRVEIGWGKSAVVEAGGRAFTTAEIDEKQWAVCLDPATGATNWKHLLMPTKVRHFAWGPGTSPVVDGDRVYFIPYAIHQKDVWEMRCPIVCLKTDGTELWRADETFWATEASTPLVVGDTLYAGADNPQRDVLVALDKTTGKLRWSAAAKSNKDRELGAPASLTYQVVDGIPQVIVATYGTREILGVHALSGEIMWRYPYPADIIIGLVSTPVAVGSRLFVCGGEGKGRNFSALLQMQVVHGKITCREVYVSTELQTNMYNTPAVYRDGVFGFGGNQRIGFLHCTNLADGRLLWRQDSKDWTKDQNLMIADGLIFALTKNDELVMAEASTERYRELGRVRLGVELGRPQQPTIANGRMYIRGKRKVVCYQVAAQRR